MHQLFPRVDKDNKVSIHIKESLIRNLAEQIQPRLRYRRRRRAVPSN